MKFYQEVMNENRRGSRKLFSHEGLLVYQAETKGSLRTDANLCSPGKTFLISSHMKKALVVTEGDIMLRTSQKLKETEETNDYLLAKIDRLEREMELARGKQKYTDALIKICGDYRSIICILPFKDTYIGFVADDIIGSYEMRVINYQVLGFMGEPKWLMDRVYEASLEAPNPFYYAGREMLDFEQKSIKSVSLVDNMSKYPNIGIGSLGIQAVARFLKGKGYNLLTGTKPARNSNEMKNLHNFYQKNGFTQTESSVTLIIQ